MEGSSRRTIRTLTRMKQTTEKLVLDKNHKWDVTAVEMLIDIRNLIVTFLEKKEMLPVNESEAAVVLDRIPETNDVNEDALSVDVPVDVEDSGNRSDGDNEEHFANFDEVEQKYQIPHDKEPNEFEAESSEHLVQDGVRKDVSNPQVTDADIANGIIFPEEINPPPKRKKFGRPRKYPLLNDQVDADNSDVKPKKKKRKKGKSGKPFIRFEVKNPGLKIRTAAGVGTIPEEALQYRKTRHGSYANIAEEVAVPKELLRKKINKTENYAKKQRGSDDDDDDDWSTAQFTVLQRGTMYRKEKNAQKLAAILAEEKKLDMKPYTERPAHKCSKCAMVFLKLETLNRHQRKHEGKKEHQCKVCSASFKLRRNLKGHMATHTDEQPFTCGVCAIGCAKQKHLLAHIKMVHNNEDPGEMSPDEDVKAHKCDICHKGFRDNHTLRQHKIIHTDDKPHICDICGNGFRTKWTLMDHVGTHSEGRPFICELCGKAFKTHGTLTKHKYSIHSKVRTYTCTFCRSSFKRQSNLRVHLMRHQGNKRHCCHFCGKGFQDKQVMKRHLMIHTGEKPHICRECGQAFNQSGTLRMHLRTHTGASPYQCTICDTTFTQSVSLAQHSKKVHGIHSKGIKVKIIAELADTPDVVAANKNRAGNVIKTEIISKESDMTVSNTGERDIIVSTTGESAELKHAVNAIIENLDAVDHNQPGSSIADNERNGSENAGIVNNYSFPSLLDSRLQNSSLQNTSLYEDTNMFMTPIMAAHSRSVFDNCANMVPNYGGHGSGYQF